jgi:hypothetical protein
MKHRISHSSMPYLLTDIEIELSVGGKQKGVAFQREIPVTVDFTYTPGYAGTFGGAMEDAEPGFEAEIHISAVMPTLQTFIEVTDEDEKAQAALVLDSGRCLLWMLSDAQIKDIEDAVDKYMSEGEDL